MASSGEARRVEVGSAVVWQAGRGKERNVLAWSGLFWQAR